jgi:adenosylcobinamide-phosphate synthase
MVDRIQLDSGASLLVNDERVTITLSNNRDHIRNDWTTLSSAVLNGGLFTNASVVINFKVPPDYDGVTPNPVELLEGFARQQKLDPSKTIGLLTAASLKTLKVSTRAADGVVVDAIVTAGISNARRVGVDADYFIMHDDSCKEIGTINAVVVTNAALTPAALVEAYAIAIEAKCAACMDLWVVCSKSGQVAQGTGTDCCVMATRNTGRTVQHAGKHTLFAELVGQAVYEATREALFTNIYHIHGNLFLYTLRQCTRQLERLCRGSRPCIPPKPMMPVPWAPTSVLIVGVVLLFVAFQSPLVHSAQVVIAVAACDRYLGEPPLSIHPVVLVGRMITFALQKTPEQVYGIPVLGFICGILLLLFMLVASLTTTWLILVLMDVFVSTLIEYVESYSSILPATFITTTIFLGKVGIWLLEVILVKSACSLQLLCTIALQMAKLLERRQLSNARAQLSWLCSRDPSHLSPSELAGATLESLSENLSDGFVAPLFWYIHLGPLGAIGYRIVNTLDSRVGYRGKYEWFGKASARFDDVLNLIPARITALLLAIAAVAVSGCDGWNGLRVAWRDCTLCESPNAGWPMACMAGILGVRLDKKGEYSLGKDGSLPNVDSIRRGQHVSQLAGGLAVVVAVVACTCISTR